MCWGVKDRNILQKAFFRSFVLAKLYTKNVPLSVVFWFFVVGSDVVFVAFNLSILHHSLNFSLPQIHLLGVGKRILEIKINLLE